jgi:hypothetical protein
MPARKVDVASLSRLARIQLSGYTPLTPCVIDGPINGESFLAYVEQILSPDINPIEQVFAKLKTLLRKAAERTVEATWRRIGALLPAFSPAECANYFVNAGYASK